MNKNLAPIVGYAGILRNNKSFVRYSTGSLETVEILQDLLGLMVDRVVYTLAKPELAVGSELGEYKLSFDSSTYIEHKTAIEAHRIYYEGDGLFPVTQDPNVHWNCFQFSDLPSAKQCQVQGKYEDGSSLAKGLSLWNIHCIPKEIFNSAKKKKNRNVMCKKLVPGESIPTSILFIENRKFDTLVNGKNVAFIHYILTPGSMQTEVELADAMNHVIVEDCVLQCGCDAWKDDFQGEIDCDAFEYNAGPLRAVQESLRRCVQDEQNEVAHRVDAFMLYGWIGSRDEDIDDVMKYDDWATNFITECVMRYNHNNDPQVGSSVVMFYCEAYAALGLNEEGLRDTAVLSSEGGQGGAKLLIQLALDQKKITAQEAANFNLVYQDYAKHQKEMNGNDDVKAHFIKLLTEQFGHSRAKEIIQLVSEFAKQKNARSNGSRSDQSTGQVVQQQHPTNMHVNQSQMQQANIQLTSSQMGQLQYSGQAQHPPSGLTRYHNNSPNIPVYNTNAQATQDDRAHNHPNTYVPIPPQTSYNNAYQGNTAAGYNVNGMQGKYTMPPGHNGGNTSNSQYNGQQNQGMQQQQQQQRGLNPPSQHGNNGYYQGNSNEQHFAPIVQQQTIQHPQQVMHQQHPQQQAYHQQYPLHNVDSGSMNNIPMHYTGNHVMENSARTTTYPPQLPQSQNYFLQQQATNPHVAFNNSPFNPTEMIALRNVNSAGTIMHGLQNINMMQQQQLGKGNNDSNQNGHGFSNSDQGGFHTNISKTSSLPPRVQHPPPGQSSAPASVATTPSEDPMELEKGTVDEFKVAGDKAAELDVFPMNNVTEEEAKARQLMKMHQVNADSTQSANRIDVTAGDRHASTSNKHKILYENIVDVSRLYNIQLSLQAATGKGVSKISEEACFLLSEAIQLHAQNILDQCSTTSRRRRHLSLISSYGYIGQSLRLGKGIPQHDSRTNLALKFGVDTKTILQNEDTAIRSVIKERTKAWEAEVLESFRKESESKQSGSKKRTMDDNGPTSSESKWVNASAAETNGILTWSEIAAHHFREKVAVYHKVGPYANGKSPNSGTSQPALKKSKSDEKPETKTTSANPPAVVSDKSMSATSSSASTSSNSSSVSRPATQEISSTPANKASTTAPAAPPSWVPAPCPMGVQTPDIITEVDMKNVLLKYAAGHPRCNGPLHDTSVLCKSLNRGARFGMGYASPAPRVAYPAGVKPS